ncbi:hypothetical protein L6164_008357 [Bauhinia variegata]|uniref:Uncharacterized protein n=1 Tax=Bauhinia variegata TaxID=167791 RepID=A0ACB9PHM1_BAUVA|nr:hypothetical protein L6164_008357 [Bauhinia variegata]
MMPKDWDSLCALGHRAKNCPQVKDSMEDFKHCYNCGETGHSLVKCPQPLQERGTKFAVCFVCNEYGHLSQKCPQNTHGIYPKGEKGSVSDNGRVSTTFGTEERPSGWVTKLLSGDDLQDDFMTDDINSGAREKSTKSQDDIL